MKKLEKKESEISDSKTYFIYSGDDAQFIIRVRMEFGMSNAELGRYCLDLLRAVIKYPQVIEFINELEKTRK